MSGSFADRVRQQLEEARKGAATQNPFLPILEDFAKGLTSADVVAEVVASEADPRRLSLVLHPAHQPARRSAVLNVVLATNAVIVMGEKQKALLTPDDLEKWLLEFMAQSALVESIGELAMLAKSPVEGYLRQARPGEVSRDDVLVEVSPDQQAAIGAATSGAVVKVVARPSTFPGAGLFDPMKPPVAFESAGLVLENVAVAAHAGELHIQGTKR